HRSAHRGRSRVDDRAAIVAARRAVVGPRPRRDRRARGHVARGAAGETDGRAPRRARRRLRAQPRLACVRARLRHADRVGRDERRVRRCRGAARLPRGPRLMTATAPLAGDGTTTTPMLDVRDVDAGYGPFRAVFGVSFTLAPGSVLALLGSNGAGKT